MKHVLTRDAREDLRQIVRYIRKQQHSPQNAQLVAKRLHESFTLLAKHPGIGHVREELEDDSLRVMSVSGLLVIYNPTTNPLIILRIIHPGRDIRSIEV